MPTHKLLDLVELRLREMSNMELGHFVVGLADAFDSHQDWQGEGCFPPPLPKIDELRQVGVKHLTLSQAAEGGDRYLAAQRDAWRATAELTPTMLVQWAIIRSIRENNPGLIAKLGLQPKIPLARLAAPSTVTAPPNPKVKHGRSSGSAFISTGKVKGSRIYEVGICQGDPSQEASWSIVGPFDHCRNIEVPGLEPGKVYYFRVRCFVGGAMSPWSAIVSLMII